MSLVDDVNAALKDAMRARDKERLTALRGIRAAFIEALKEDGADDLDDDRSMAILRKLAKSRAESIKAYTDGGRDDLVEAEQAELSVIEGFLPQLADEATTAAWIDAIIAETGASSMRDMGKVMGALKVAHGAKLDGALASKLVKARLS